MAYFDGYSSAIGKISPILSHKTLAILPIEAQKSGFRKKAAFCMQPRREKRGAKLCVGGVVGVGRGGGNAYTLSPSSKFGVAG